MHILEIVDPDVFRNTLVEALLYAVERGQDIKTIQSILIGDVNKCGKVDPGEIPVVLDVYREPGDDSPRLARDQTAQFYSTALKKQDPETANGICAVTGKEALLSPTLPSPRLPALADTILFSANPDIPCVTRYGLTGSSAFPIGKNTAQRLNDTASWMTAADRKGKTWSQVARADKSGRDLVLTYVDLDPALDAPLAELLSSIETMQAEGIFQSKAASVQKVLGELRGKLKAQQRCASWCCVGSRRGKFKSSHRAPTMWIACLRV